MGSPQIRNQATLAGNIQTASPAGDAYVTAYALDGVVVLESKKGVRKLPLATFASGPRKTEKAPDEVIAAVEILKRKWTYESFFKVGMRNAMAISVANGVVCLDVKDGLVKDCRICVGACAPTPIRIFEAEELLKGKALSAELAEQVGEIVKTAVNPISDLRASAEYRRYIAGTMVKKELEKCLEVK